jgi:2-phosphoglycerate kinase
VKVLLLGGTTAAGKSTSGYRVARRLGIACLSADSVWRALFAFTSADRHPVLFQWPRAEESGLDPEQLARIHIQESEALTPALEAFVKWEMKEGNRFVMQGAWITPDLAASLREPGNVRAVFIDETDEASILAWMVERSGLAEPTRRQTVMAKTAALYGEWIRDGAKRQSVPLVAARPRETLIDRILAEAERTET